MVRERCAYRVVRDMPPAPLKMEEGTQPRDGAASRMSSGEARKRMLP